jgi:hypothetical protein
VGLLVEEDWHTGEVRIAADGHLPRFLLARRLSRSLRRYEREGYEVVDRFGGPNDLLFESGQVHTLDADRPKVRMVGAVLRRRS